MYRQAPQIRRTERCPTAGCSPFSHNGVPVFSTHTIPNRFRSYSGTVAQWEGYGDLLAFPDVRLHFIIRRFDWHSEDHQLGVRWHQTCQSDTLSHCGRLQRNDHDPYTHRRAAGSRIGISLTGIS